MDSSEKDALEKNLWSKEPCQIPRYMARKIVLWLDANGNNVLALAACSTLFNMGGKNGQQGLDMLQVRHTLGLLREGKVEDESDED